MVLTFDEKYFLQKLCDCFQQILKTAESMKYKFSMFCFKCYKSDEQCKSTLRTLFYLFIVAELTSIIPLYKKKCWYSMFTATVLLFKKSDITLKFYLMKSV